MIPHEANEVVRRAAYLVEARGLQRWTKSIVTVPEATLLPQTMLAPPDLELAERPKRLPAANGGVYARDGAIVPEAIHFGGQLRYVPDRWEAPPAGATRLPGRWLFGGLLRDHFGHFVLESLARLWGQDEAAPLDGIVFIAFNGRTGSGVPVSDKSVVGKAAALSALPFVQDTLRLFCGDLPIHVVGPPAVAEELVIPSQLIGNANMVELIAGHPDFHEFVHRALARFRPPPDSSRRRLYVSRSRLPADRVLFLSEEKLERALAEEGYEILYPETMTVTDQIAAYAAAAEIVAPTGSALHLAAYAMNGAQRVAVIDRQLNAPPKFERQLRAFGARDVVSIGHVIGSIKHHGGGNYKRKQIPAHVLDLDAIWRDLLAAGFVSHPREFGRLDEAELATALAGHAARLGDAVLEFVPASRDDAPELQTDATAKSSKVQQRKARRAARRARRAVLSQETV